MRHSSKCAVPGFGSLATVVTAIVTASTVVWMVTFGAPPATLFVQPAHAAPAIVAAR